MADPRFTFVEQARRQLATPRWMRQGLTLVVGLSLLVVSIFFGERLRNAYQTLRLEGRWLGVEDAPDGLWSREVEYHFRDDGQVSITLRLRRTDLEGPPEVSTVTHPWSVRSGYLIVESPVTGPVPARISRITSQELRFGGDAKIKQFRRLPGD